VLIAFSPGRSDGTDIFTYQQGGACRRQGISLKAACSCELDQGAMPSTSTGAEPRLRGKRLRRAPQRFERTPLPDCTRIRAVYRRRSSRKYRALARVVLTPQGPLNGAALLSIQRTAGLFRVGVS